MSELGKKERSHLTRRIRRTFDLSSGGEPVAMKLSMCVEITSCWVENDNQIQNPHTGKYDSRVYKLLL